MQRFLKTNILSLVLFLTLSLLLPSLGWASCKNVGYTQNFCEYVPGNNHCATSQGANGEYGKCNEREGLTCYPSGPHPFNSSQYEPSLCRCNFILCDTQAEADSVKCVKAGNSWANGSCLTPKEACEQGGGNWLNEQCVTDENFATCIPHRDACKSKNGTFTAISIIDNVCSFECQIELEKDNVGLKYTNSKYYILDKKTSTETEITQNVYEYIEETISSCKENSIKLFRGILNGSYIYWRSDEAEPVNVQSKILIK